MIQLKNSFLTVDIEHPQEGYLGARFDHSGKVVQITDVKGNTYFTRERLSANVDHKLGMGLFGEFGIDTPIGYDTCKVGEYFPKIGVGMLKKVSELPYDFFFDYEQTPFDIKVTQPSNTEVIFECLSDNTHYPFYLQKKLSLVDQSLCVSYRFENRGDKIISTNEYLHNFLSINNEGVVAGLMLEFDQSINQDSFLNGLNPQRVVALSEVSSNIVHFMGTPESDLFYNDFISDPTLCTDWFLSNNNGVSISESVDFPVQKVNLWGAGHVISPELFIGISIRPKESLLWKRVFHVQGDL